MKKLLKLLLGIVVLFGAVGGITYACLPKDERQDIVDILKKPIEYLQSLFSNNAFMDTSKFKSDELFDSNSKVKLSVNQTAFNSYFTDKTLTSNKELVKLYQDAYRSLRIFQTNAVDPQLDLYINVENDLGKSMYIYVTVSFAEEEIYDYNPDFVPVAKITSIEIKWYNQELIGKYENGKTTYGITSQSLLGTSFKITNKSKAAVKVLQGEGSGWKDYDLEYAYHMDNQKVDDIITTDAEGNYTGINLAKYTASEIQRICDSFYTDLFQIDVAKDETTAAIGKIKKISLYGLKRIADCTYDYDKDTYGEHPLSDIWNSHSKEYKDTMNVGAEGMLLFAVDFFNEKTLEKLTFYMNVFADSVFDSKGNVIADTNGYVEVYEYRNNVFYLVGLYSGTYKWASSKEYDLTDYREWSLEQTFMFSDYTLDLRIENLMGSTATFENLMSINETDFPSEIMQNIFETIEKEKN